MLVAILNDLSVVGRSFKFPLLCGRIGILLFYLNDPNMPIAIPGWYNGAYIWRLRLLSY
jgi:hypothetical protein